MNNTEQAIAKANQYRNEDGKFGDQPLSENEGGTANDTMGRYQAPQAKMLGGTLGLPNGEWVELDHSISEGTEPLLTTHNDGGVTVSYLVDDADTFDYSILDESSELKEFRSEQTRDAFIAEQKALVGSDHVFIVDKYDHSGTHYSLADTVNYPDRKFDVAPSNVLVVPADVPSERAEDYAEGCLSERNAVNAGEVYGVVTQQWDAHGVELESEAVWGHIGDDYAEEAAKENFTSAAKHYDENLSTPTLF